MVGVSRYLLTISPAYLEMRSGVSLSPDRSSRKRASLKDRWKFRDCSVMLDRYKIVFEVLNVTSFCPIEPLRLSQRRGQLSDSGHLDIWRYTHITLYHQHKYSQDPSTLLRRSSFKKKSSVTFFVV